MRITVDKADTNAEKNDFIMFEWAVNEKNPNWVAPMISEQRKLITAGVHPFHSHGTVELFLARDEQGTIVGRIAAIENRLHNEFHGEKAAFFGLFECVDSKDVSTALFSEAERWAAGRGLSLMRGPASFSTNEICGLLVKGFDRPPCFMMPYNPSYYEGLILSSGYAKSKDLLAYHIDKNLNIPEKMLRVVDRVKTRENVVLRHLDMARFDSELMLIKEVYNKAWSKNWGFVPMTDEEFEFTASDFKKIVVPELLLIAEVDGKPAGFSLIMPDINLILKKINGRLFPFGFLHFIFGLKKIRQLRLITLGVVHEYQKRGIDAVLYSETITRALGLGYESAEISWVLEDNDLMNRAILSFGAKVSKRYRFYDKILK